jgi:hypothetical protein
MTPIKILQKITLVYFAFNIISAIGFVLLYILKVSNVVWLTSINSFFNNSIIFVIFGYSLYCFNYYKATKEKKLVFSMLIINLYSTFIITSLLLKWLFGINIFPV